MQTDNTTFVIREYSDDGIMLIRYAVRNDDCEGLSPQTSQAILMTKQELDKLKEVIDTHAIKRRN